MQHPYLDLPAQAFWRSGVAGADRGVMPGLYQPKVALTRATSVATFGSCFAQHIGGHLRRAGCSLLDAEPPPPSMPAAVARRFGYGQFSARCGNIYATRALADLLAEVLGGVAEAGCVWPLGDRWVDAFRPTVEPEGLDSPAEVLVHRNLHLARLAEGLARTDLLIFTMGLTEVWMDNIMARALPSCPGTVAGRFDPDRHALKTLKFTEVLADLHRIRALLHQFRPGMQILLTVSPVPLTATAGGQHVLTATSAAKATLRAAAAEFAALPDVDYVPSYDLLTHPAMGHWFAANQRSISPEGVDWVMRLFLAAHGLDSPGLPDLTQDHARLTVTGPARAVHHDRPDPHCDDALLDAFAPALQPA